MTVTDDLGPGDGYPDDDADDFDDVPATHLDDDAYDEFLEREFDGRGTPRGAPRVGVVIVVLIVLVLAVAVVLFGRG